MLLNKDLFNFQEAINFDSVILRNLVIEVFKDINMIDVENIPEIFKDDIPYLEIYYLKKIFEHITNLNIEILLYYIIDKYDHVYKRVDDIVLFCGAKS
jgi:hypothetical protein